MMGGTLPCVCTVICLLLNSASAVTANETLGCWHYGFAYSGSNTSSHQNSTIGCQAFCAAAGSCTRFTYWPSTQRCELVAAGAFLQFAPNAVAGPSSCPGVSPACTELPSPPERFPGTTIPASNAVWPSGETPTSLQCWPWSVEGYPEQCPHQAVTVLEDTQDDWAGTCAGLTIQAVPPGQTCEETCSRNVQCSVWQEVNASGQLSCWQGSMGNNCYDRTSGLVPQRAGHIMHGTYRVLMDLTGIQVMGLKWNFPSSAFPTWKSGAPHCRLQCIASLTCQWWLYSVEYGCYVEDTNNYRVAYPLTWGANCYHDSSFAHSVVAGEYIQHYCGGDAASAGVDAAQSARDALAQDGSDSAPSPAPWVPSQGSALPPVQERDSHDPHKRKDVWWTSWLLYVGLLAIVFVVAALCLLLCLCTGGRGKPSKKRQAKSSSRERDLELTEKGSITSRDDELAGTPLLTD